MIVGAIFDAVVDAMDGITPIVDEYSPGQFTASPFMSLEESTIDRSYIVTPTGFVDRNMTGTPAGVTNRVMTFDVVVKHINEGNSWNDANKKWAQDVVKIQDIVQGQLREVSGVGECTADGDATATQGDEPGTTYTRVPFRVEYVDDLEA